MGWTLLTVLFLARSTATGVVYPETLPTPTNFFNNIISAAAAATGDPTVTACSAAYNAVSSCASIPGFTDAPLAAQIVCLCSVSTTVGLGMTYSSCADYISSNYPRSSAQYSGMLLELPRHVVKTWAMTNIDLSGK